MIKELYLFIAAVIGALITLTGVIINNRIQLKISRENQKNQLQTELLKSDKSIQREASARLREKIEEAHQILSRIVSDNSMTASHIALDTGLTAQEYHQHYQKSRDEVHRLQMIADLYLPKIHKSIDDIASLTNIFWGAQQTVLYQHSQGNKDLTLIARREIVKISTEITYKVADSKLALQEIIVDLGTLN
ncbi:MAG TPA: hypothetical protein VJ725_19735 [Thermoanaerobaculia bacterium]|nr:hypothetical protein [Thermoanaerobaculia bacterium]